MRIIPRIQLIVLYRYDLRGGESSIAHSKIGFGSGCKLGGSSLRGKEGEEGTSRTSPSCPLNWWETREETTQWSKSAFVWLGIRERRGVDMAKDVTVGERGRGGGWKGCRRMFGATHHEQANWVERKRTEMKEGGKKNIGRWWMENSHEERRRKEEEGTKGREKGDNQWYHDLDGCS